MPRDLLTDFELMVLLATLRLGDQAYGVPIGREIEQTGGRSVVLAAVYTALDRLEVNRLVASRLESRVRNVAARRNGSFA